MIRVAWGEPKLDGLTSHVLFKKMDREHWVTAAGESVHVANMGDDHLVNTIRMLRRRVMAMRQDEMLLYGPYEGSLHMTDDEWLAACVPPWERMLSRAARRKLDLDRAPEPRRWEDDILADPWGKS